MLQRCARQSVRGAVYGYLGYPVDRVLELVSPFECDEHTAAPDILVATASQLGYVHGPGRSGGHTSVLVGEEIARWPIRDLVSWCTSG